MICSLLTMIFLAQTRVNADSAVVADFEKRINDYVVIQKNAVKAVGAQKPTKEPEKIIDHQRAISKAVKEARPKAAMGDIFSPDIAKEFKRLIGIALQGDAARIKKSLARAEPNNLKLRVNDPYPSRIPLQSTPPTLHMHLPALPPDLESRLN